MFRLICDYVLLKEKLLAIDTDGSFFELDLTTFDRVNLAPCPARLKNAFGTLHPSNKELFVFGGWDTEKGDANHDCFVYSFVDQSWRCEENVFGDSFGRVKGSVVIYKNLVVVLGGFGATTENAPDFAFTLPYGSIVDLPSRPGNFPVTKSLLLGSFLLVFATSQACKRQEWKVDQRRPPLAPQDCCQFFGYLDLNNIKFGWKTLGPPIQQHLFDFQVHLMGTKVVVSGGTVKIPNRDLVSNLNMFLLDLKNLPDEAAWERVESRRLLRAADDEYSDYNAPLLLKFRHELDGGALLSVEEVFDQGEMTSIEIDGENFYTLNGFFDGMLFLRDRKWWL